MQFLILLIEIVKANTSFSGLLCRIIYPPVNPVGGSDLFPGPGAGMYPTRYLSQIIAYW